MTWRAGVCEHEAHVTRETLEAFWANVADLPEGGCWQPGCWAIATTCCPLCCKELCAEHDPLTPIRRHDCLAGPAGVAT